MTIDAGGSGVKASVFCVRDWRIVSTGVREYAASYPAPHLIEFDPVVWWAAIVSAAADAVRRAAVPPGQYLAVTCAAMRIPFVLLDVRADPVTPGVLNLDGRGRPYLAEVRDALGTDALYALTGHWPAAPLGLPKLLWFKHRQPGLWARVRHVLQMHDWILHELCGQMASEPSSASMGQLLDITHRRWAIELLTPLGIDVDLFPPLRDAGSYLWGLRPAVAQAIGLEAGTPVHVGGGDTHMACLGVGGATVGTAVIVGGSTTPIQLTADAPLCDPVSRPWVSAHLWPDRWAIEMNAGVTGMLYKWLRDFCCSVCGDRASPDYAALDALAAAAPLGARELLVTAANPHWSEESWGRVPPMTLFGLTAAHSAGDVARAMLECVCYAIRGNLEQLELVNKRPFAEVILAGGASQSRLWSQILADVLGRAVRVPQVGEASAQAGGRLIVKDGSSAWEQTAPVTIYRPDSASHSAYRSHYERYRAVHADLGAVFGDVAPPAAVMER